jgi:hypothetical protein
MMGLCNGTDVSGRDESGEDIRHAIYESSGWTWLNIPPFREEQTVLSHLQTSTAIVQTTRNVPYALPPTRVQLN